MLGPWARGYLVGAGEWSLSQGYVWRSQSQVAPLTLFRGASNWKLDWICPSWERGFSWGARTGRRCSLADSKAPWLEGASAVSLPAVGWERGFQLMDFFFFCLGEGVRAGRAVYVAFITDPLWAGCWTTWPSKVPSNMNYPTFQLKKNHLVTLPGSLFPPTDVFPSAGVDIRSYWLYRSKVSVLTWRSGLAWEIQHFFIYHYSRWDVEHNWTFSLA